MAKFDWYQGTLDEDKPSQLFLDSLKNSFDLSSWVSGKGYQGYTNSLHLRRGSNDLCLVAFGGNDGVHVRGSSENSLIVSEVMRKHYVTHKVSRIDSCIDFDESGCFDKMAKKMIEFANNKKPQPLKISMLGDWANGKARTLYIGSRKSQIYIRLYEKGYESSQKLGLEVERPNWVRFEVEYKPQKEKPRRMAQGFSADDIFRISYLPELMDSFEMDFGSQILTYNKSYTDEEKARYFLLKQYGATIANWVKDEGGSFDVVFQKIQDHVIKNHF